jgi:hypothetical protein
VFLGNGDGTFRPLGTAPVLPVCGPTGVADLNGDGIPDVVWQPVPTGSFTVYLGKGDGTFGPPITNGYRLGNFDYVFADFNLDGKMDVAVGGDALLGNGDGTFQPPAPIAGMQLPAAAADLNGDGIPDLVGYNSTSSLTSLAIAFGNGDGTFGVPETFPLQGNEFNSGPTITIADWNGDGHLDIAAMPGGPYYTYFFLGDGTGHFTAQPTGILLSNTPFLAVGDFNGDGLPDVASASDSIWVLKNHSR